MNKIVLIPIVVRYAKKCNKTPTRSELATQKNELMYGMLNEQR
jgi:hypothetical protein